MEMWESTVETQETNVASRQRAVALRDAGENIED